MTYRPRHIGAGFARRACFSTIIPLVGSLVTGCASSAPAPKGDAVASLSFGDMKAGFVAGRDRAVIEVAALNRTAIRSAAIIYPDGRKIEAFSLETQEDPTSVGNALGATDGLASSVMPKPAGALPPMQGVPQMRTEATGQILSYALIRLPNLEEYGKLWARCRIDVAQGDDPSPQIFTLPAPKPAD